MGKAVDLGEEDICILNYAYALEQLKAAFYMQAIKTPSANMAAPMIVSVASTAAFSQGKKLPKKIADVLNFALTLEYLEDEFYQAALARKDLIPSETHATFGTIGNRKDIYQGRVVSRRESHEGPGAAKYRGKAIK